MACTVRHVHIAMCGSRAELAQFPLTLPSTNSLVYPTSSWPVDVGLQPILIKFTCKPNYGAGNCGTIAWIFTRFGLYIPLYDPCILKMIKHVSHM